MGHPKKQRKKFETPKKPWDKKELEKERKILMDFGLRRKHEIWRAESILREFRRRARELQAKKDERKEKEMFEKLTKMGFNCTRLDDVLSIKLEDILSRRLQTILFKKGLANTQKHARQMITHGHVTVAGVKIMWPSYIVRRGEEDGINIDHALAAKMIKQEATAVKAEKVPKNG